MNRYAVSSRVREKHEAISGHSSLSGPPSVSQSLLNAANDHPCCLTHKTTDMTSRQVRHVMEDRIRSSDDRVRSSDERVRSSDDRGRVSPMGLGLSRMASAKGAEDMRDYDDSMSRGESVVFRGDSGVGAVSRADSGRPEKSVRQGANIVESNRANLFSNRDNSGLQASQASQGSQPSQGSQASQIPLASSQMDSVSELALVKAMRRSQDRLQELLLEREEMSRKLSDRESECARLQTTCQRLELDVQGLTDDKCKKAEEANGLRRDVKNVSDRFSSFRSESGKSHVHLEEKILSLQRKLDTAVSAEQRANEKLGSIEYDSNQTNSLARRSVERITSLYCDRLSLIDFSLTALKTLLKKYNSLCSRSSHVRGGSLEMRAVTEQVETELAAFFSELKGIGSRLCSEKESLVKYLSSIEGSELGPNSSVKNALETVLALNSDEQPCVAFGFAREELQRLSVLIPAIEAKSAQLLNLRSMCAKSDLSRAGQGAGQGAGSGLGLLESSGANFWNSSTDSWRLRPISAGSANISSWKSNVNGLCGENGRLVQGLNQARCSGPVRFSGPVRDSGPLVRGSGPIRQPFRPSSVNPVRGLGVSSMSAAGVRSGAPLKPALSIQDNSFSRVCVTPKSCVLVDSPSHRKGEAAGSLVESMDYDRGHEFSSLIEASRAGAANGSRHIDRDATLINGDAYMDSPRQKSRRRHSPRHRRRAQSAFMSGSFSESQTARDPVLEVDYDDDYHIRK